MMKIMFFDLNIIGIERYPLQIANEINKYKKDIYFYFLYEEDPNKKLEEVQKKLPENSKLIKIKQPNYSYIKSLMQEISPDSFLVMAQRIPDSALVSVANELGIKTYKFQHGLYIPFMRRDIKMFFSKIFKTIRYLQYSLVIAKAIKVNKLYLLKEYINIYLKGKKITDTNLPLEKINADTVFVYGEYWKQYHKEQFGYNYDQQIIVGYPDLMILDEIKKQPQEDAICYICQTLVEDGRLKRKQMEDFVKILSENIGDKKLYIKLHPRSDMSLYKALQNRENIIFTKTDFPHCSKYLGHYSSMLAISLYLTNEVFLWKFENHNEYPFYLVENAKTLSNSIEEIKSFIQIDIERSDITNNIKDYFYFNENPLNRIKRELLS
jgi:hypothetical protein